MEKKNIITPQPPIISGVNPEKIMDKTMTPDPVPQANLDYHPYTTIPSEKE